MLLGIACLILAVGILLVVAAYKKRQPASPTFNQGVNLIEDFLAPNVAIIATAGAYSSLYCLGTSTNTGAVTSVGPNTTIPYAGVVSVAVSATNDTASVATPKAYTLASSTALDIQTRFYFDTLPTGSDVSKTRFGFSDHIDPVSLEGVAASIYFDPSVSNNYVCYVLSVANGLTQVITNVPAAPMMDTYLRIIISPSQVQFFINSDLVATISSNVPDALTAMQVGWGRKKTSGSTQSKIFVDAITIVQNFVTPRAFQQLNQ